MELPVIPMTWEEFEVMEAPFGWKVEYWDGHAHLTPRWHGVKTKLQLSPRNATYDSDPSLVAVSPDYRDSMIAGYCETFGNSIEFSGWSRSDLQSSAVQDIDYYFGGHRGEPLSASVLALGAGQLAGLALISRRPKYGAYMDLLYVRPGFQRQGVATAMLNRVIAGLLELGFPTLTSAYHIVNEPSRHWHHGQGFEDQHDWYYARLKVGWYGREMGRREKLGLVTGLDELRRERERWAALAALPEDGDGV
jgi:GNAT superfamily N-acetyltransferase